MYPFIHEDSLIFIDTSNKGINNKDVFVVNVNDELFIKQIIYQGNLFTLKSFNSDYKDINIKVDELVVIGKVKGVLNKI
jgi:phage repressor protein C with HTH and peptisase S24 domain